MCSKGETKCRHSNFRVKEKLQKFAQVAAPPELNKVESQSQISQPNQEQYWNKTEYLRKADRIRLESQVNFMMATLGNKETQADTNTIKSLNDRIS